MAVKWLVATALTITLIGASDAPLSGPALQGVREEQVTMDFDRSAAFVKGLQYNGLDFNSYRGTDMGKTMDRLEGDGDEQDEGSAVDGAQEFEQEDIKAFSMLHPMKDKEELTARYKHADH